MSEVSEGDLLEYVLDERKMELAAEGKRWYDLLRFGKRNGFEYRERFLINEVIQYNNTANSSWIRSVLKNDDALYLPVWTTELESNKLLEQNPYYVIVK
ncbi:MAG: RagB/SusD family nutrient uptake outer membrane protein [Mangrovibacterium sp.]